MHILRTWNNERKEKYKKEWKGRKGKSYTKLIRRSILNTNHLKGIKKHEAAL